MEWAARIEWTAPHPYTCEDLAELVRVLGEYHVSLTRAPVPEELGETWAADLLVEAHSLRRGASRAIAVVEAATGQGATGIDVMLSEVHQWRSRQ